MMKRVEYIDAMRGVTMIFVVFSHIVSFAFGDIDIAYNDVISRFRMPLFFFISGWVFYKAERVWNKNTTIKILKKKFMVQIIPFLVFMFLSLYVNDMLELKSFGSDKQGYWFTLVLFEFFVLYIFAVSFFQRDANKAQGDWQVFLFVVAISCISFYYSKYYSRYTIELGHIKTIAGLFSFTKVRFFIFFWFGTFVRKYFDKFIEWTNNKYTMAVALILFVLMAIFPQLFSIIGIELVAFVMVGICGIVIVFTFFRVKEDLFKKEHLMGCALQYIGRRTLDIYLLHYFFLPKDLTSLGVFLCVYENKPIGLIVGICIAIWVIIISLFVSELIRLSSFLGHYLFGAKQQ